MGGPSYTRATLPPEIIAGLPPYLQAEVPHYDDTLQPNLYAAAIISIVAAYIATGLRLWARKLRAQKLWWDDYMCLVALFFVSVFTALTLYVTVLGLGRYSVKVIVEHPENVIPFSKALISGAVIYSPSLLCSKLSLLLLFYRLFSGRVYKWILVTVGLFVIGYSLSAVLVNLLHCIPIEYNWDMTIKGHCFDTGIEPVFLAVLNVVTDVAILVLPLPYIWRLHSGLRSKLQLTAIFSFGSFIIVVAIIRTVQVSGLQFTDGFWGNGPGIIWSVVEVGLAVVAACLPVLRPVFNKLVYGDATAPVQEPSYERNIVTIGGSEIPMNVFKSGKETRSKTTIRSTSKQSTLAAQQSSIGNESVSRLVEGRNGTSTKSMV
ncbi:hypothetical protein NPX13_g389 [Xylaria arbuscula]|uniref:Rhodopsin domain-containing protein n=1 Tax=Xylaria arbuscula TaxID=114810 RepID=A0A9W8NP03_9PEZI|nr:hypothetical protein NPX13_g389 [Xylaria arbuscula]